MNCRVHKMKKDEFQLAVFNKLRQYSINVFFKHLLELQSLLEDTNFSPCLFRFDPVFINIIRLVPKHLPGINQRY